MTIRSVVPLDEIRVPMKRVRIRPIMPRLAELSEADERAVVKGVAFDTLKAEYSRRMIAEGSDVGELVADFLRTRKSEATVRRYRGAIRVWLSWCEGAGIEHPLLAECKDADLFAAQLTGAAASINSTISAVSSWYSTLVKWGKVSRTPFVKVARRAEAASEHAIPTAREVKIILDAL